MIAATNAKELLQKNLQRTEMLIAAMEKIKAFNQSYQMKQTDPEYYRMVRTIQDKELADIEQSCGEHAIISLVTAFETYYRELTQQLLAQYRDYFVARRTCYSDKVIDLIQSDEVLNYEDIEQKLQLKNRFEYYKFFSAYSVPFLSQKDNELVEYLYDRRNNYVHNAGRSDGKLRQRLGKKPSPIKETTTGTDAKRLRTKLAKALGKSYGQVIVVMEKTG